MGKFAWKTYGVRKNGAADFALPRGLGGQEIGTPRREMIAVDVRREDFGGFWGIG